MSQAYSTSYGQDYKWTVADRVQLFHPVDAIAIAKLDDDLWFHPKKTDESLQDPKQFRNAMAKVKRANRRKFWSTYQRHFCKDEMYRKENMLNEEETDLEFIEEADIPQEIISKNIPAPLNSACRILGYLRPDDLRMPLSTYEGELGLTAHEMLQKGLYKTCGKDPHKEEIETKIRENQEMVQEILNSVSVSSKLGKQCNCTSEKICSSCAFVKNMNLKDYC